MEKFMPSESGFACEERGTGGEPVGLKLDCLLREGHRRV